MMQIKYITTDLELKSNENLNKLALELCAGDVPHLNQWVDDVYRVVIGGTGIAKTPEDDVIDFCKKIDALSIESKKLWDTCTSRVLDMAFESGKEPTSITYLLPADLIQCMNQLKLGVAITIYPVGAYSD